MKKWHNGLKLLAIVLSLALAVPFSVISAVAASATTKIKHKSPKEYIPGFRINLDAEIKDDVGVLLARCYFKTKQDKNFAFVDMLPGADRDYRATLPAPWVNSEAIDYVFVVVNEEKKVVRSQVFIIEEKETEEAAAWKEPGEVGEIRLDVVQEAVEAYEVLKKQLVTKYKDKLPKCQQEIATGELDVKTELEKSAEQLEGFYDNVVVTEVPASMKYGMLAEGIYTSEQIAAAGGQSSVASATGAASVGTVTASAGLSTAAIIGIGVAVAAGVGGGVAAYNAYDDDDDDDDDSGSGGGGGGPINVSATVEWGDYDDGSVSGWVADDAFDLWFAGRYLGRSPLGGSSGVTEVSGLEVGTHQLQIQFVTQDAGLGTYGITLGGGATFSSGGTVRSGALTYNESAYFDVIVPSP